MHSQLNDNAANSSNIIPALQADNTEHTKVDIKRPKWKNWGEKVQKYFTL